MRGYQPIRVGGYGDWGRDHTCVCACARAWVCLCLCVCVCVCVCVYPWVGRFCDSLELQSRPCSSSCWLACSWRHLATKHLFRNAPYSNIRARKEKTHEKIILVQRPLEWQDDVRSKRLFYWYHTKRNNVLNVHNILVLDLSAACSLPHRRHSRLKDSCNKCLLWLKSFVYGKVCCLCVVSVSSLLQHSPTICSNSFSAHQLPVPPAMTVGMDTRNAAGQISASFWP